MTIEPVAFISACSVPFDCTTSESSKSDTSTVYDNAPAAALAAGCAVNCADWSNVTVLERGITVTVVLLKTNKIKTKRTIIETPAAIHIQSRDDCGRRGTG